MIQGVIASEAKQSQGLPRRFAPRNDHFVMPFAAGRKQRRCNEIQHKKCRIKSRKHEIRKSRKTDSRGFSVGFVFFPFRVLVVDVLGFFKWPELT
jgi:hypothetical protein